MPYDLTIRTTFSAAHSIRIAGEPEPLHGHDWSVVVQVTAESLDDEGLVCDFHALEASLASIVAPFRNGNLNEIAPFNDVNPTAEHVARHIAMSMIPMLPEGVSLAFVRIGEAPGCEATYRPL
ncbi:MAG: 6-carboxytetrahydropterin synthase [Phycisphaeraceae bacterium]|nr:6-carboxytetrahydropterin synthase [Phycisphaeraceae bacterium]